LIDSPDTINVFSKFINIELSTIIYKYRELTSKVGGKFLQINYHHHDVIINALDCKHFNCAYSLPNILMYYALNCDRNIVDYIMDSNQYKECLSKELIPQELIMICERIQKLF